MPKTFNSLYEIPGASALPSLTRPMQWLSFNSLYEIQNWTCAEVAEKRPILSILFMRFKPPFFPFFNIAFCLSILFMRFLYALIDEAKRLNHTFNSLYEIHCGRRAGWSLRTCSLSILFMRFHVLGVAGRLANTILSILFMRFSWLRMAEAESLQGLFQFSLWDSKWRWLKRRKWFLKHFQFSLWDSERILTSNHGEGWKLSILFMRF